ncbi:hypothetical protein GCM10010278_67010 [Streptomyces melanogenes]|nr:hypothetical protein GCM10010278_67010 [Streptomyces melanogenes]
MRAQLAQNRQQVVHQARIARLKVDDLHSSTVGTPPVRRPAPPPDRATDPGSALVRTAGDPLESKGPNGSKRLNH